MQPPRRFVGMRVGAQEGDHSGLRIAIVKRDSLTSWALKDYLESIPGMRLSWWPTDQFERARPPQFDVLVADAAQNGDRPTYCRQLRQSAMTAKLVAVVDEADFTGVLDMIQAGVVGFFERNCPPQEILEVLTGIQTQGVAFSRSLAQRMSELSTPNNASPSANGCHLTARETKVLALIAGGRTNKEMADELHIARRTVEHDRAALVRKLKIRSVAGLVKYAISHGILRPEDRG